MFLLEEIRNAGFPGLFLLLLGVVGLVLSALSIAFAASRKRSAFFVGIATLALAALLGFGGVLGTSYGRHLTDEAVSAASISRVQVERIRRIGYDESRSAAKLGLIFAVLPLLTGALAAFVGAAQRKDEAAKSPILGQASVPSPEGGGMLVPFVFLGLDILAMAGAVMFFVSPLPGRAWEYNDPRWKILEAADEVLHPLPGASHNGLDEGLAEQSPACARLEMELGSTSTRLDELSNLPEAASRCVEQRLLHSATLESKSGQRRALEELGKSPLVRDEETRKKVRDSLEKIPKDEPTFPLGKDDTEGSGQPSGSVSETSASGRLPRAVIQRIIRQSMASIRRCYEKSLKNNPALEGTVKVRFVIGRDGSVANAGDHGSDIADPAMVSCVVNVIKGLGFPQPEGGIVTVVYPFRFQPG